MGVEIQEPPKPNPYIPRDTQVEYRSLFGFGRKHTAPVLLPKGKWTTTEAEQTASWLLTHKPLWRRSIGKNLSKRVAPSEPQTHPIPPLFFQKGLKAVRAIHTPPTEQTLPPQSAYQTKETNLAPSSPFMGIRSDIPQVPDTMKRGDTIEIQPIQTGGFSPEEAAEYDRLDKLARR